MTLNSPQRTLNSRKGNEETGTWGRGGTGIGEKGWAILRVPKLFFKRVGLRMANSRKTPKYLGGKLPFAVPPAVPNQFQSSTAETSGFSDGRSAGQLGQAEVGKGSAQGSPKGARGCVGKRPNLHVGESGIGESCEGPIGSLGSFRDSDLLGAQGPSGTTEFGGRARPT